MHKYGRPLIYIVSASRQIWQKRLVWGVSVIVSKINSICKDIGVLVQKCMYMHNYCTSYFQYLFYHLWKKIHCKSIEILHIYVNESTIYLKGGYLRWCFQKKRMGIRYEFAECSTLKCDSRVYFAQFYAYSLTSVNFPHAKK